MNQSQKTYQEQIDEMNKTYQEQVDEMNRQRVKEMEAHFVSSLENRVSLRRSTNHDVPEMSFGGPGRPDARHFALVENTDENQERLNELGRRVSELSPTRSLILEVLCSRWRLGYNLWTFSTQLSPQIRDLEEEGWVSSKGGIVEKTLLVSLTNAGLAATALPGTISDR